MVKVSLIMWDKDYDIALPKVKILPIQQQLVCQWEITETSLKCSNPAFNWVITEKSKFTHLIRFWLAYTEMWKELDSTTPICAKAVQFGDNIVINCNYVNSRSRWLCPQKIARNHSSRDIALKISALESTFKKKAYNIQDFIQIIHSYFIPNEVADIYTMSSKRFTLVIQGDLYEIEKYFLNKQTGSLFSKPKCLTKENTSINIQSVFKQDKNIFS